MTHVLRVAIVDPKDSSRESLKSMLLGIDTIWLDADCSRYEFFQDVVQQTHPDIAIIALDAKPEKALELVARINEVCPECSIFVVSGSTDGNLILRAMRAGAKEFLTQPLKTNDIADALSRMEERRAGKGKTRSRGTATICVAGATGGVGSTSIAVNLACALAKNPDRTVGLVDLDLCLGDADVFLDTIPDYTIVDVAQNVTRLDFTLLKRSLTKHASGVYLLPRPVSMQDVSLITPEDLQRVIGLLKATFSHLVIDLSKGYTQNDMVAMSMATSILLVTQMDLPCLRNVVRLLATLGPMEGVGEKIRIVLNRTGLGDTQISLKKAQDTIGREIYWQLPNDYRTMVEVRNNGVPLVDQSPKAAVTQAIVGLAETLGGEQEQEDAAKQADPTKSSIGKILGFWSKGKSSK
ncbi:MAG: P-loop NTPase [Planctomycetia bacterium]|nr:P-loop NTPase [Planctomycetia bacterium]